MTETLSAEEFLELKDSVEFEFDSLKDYPTYSNIHMQKALNTIEAKDKEIKMLRQCLQTQLRPREDNEYADKQYKAKDQEIEALKGQVAAFNSYLNRLTNQFIKWKIFIPKSKLADAETWSKFESEFKELNTQATAEAFIAKERADEREKAIKECVELCREFKNYPYLPKGILKQQLEALLTKEQA